MSGRSCAGLEVQKWLRASQVLIVGMKGLGLKLPRIYPGGSERTDHAGSQQVSPEDHGAQFLIRTGSVGQNRAEASLERAQNLNPVVDVKVDTEDTGKEPDAFFTQLDAMCLTYCSGMSSLS
ncbi:SUMO-activating enzyme subunit 1 [Lemmus lemmus]